MKPWNGARHSLWSAVNRSKSSKSFTVAKLREHPSDWRTGWGLQYFYWKINRQYPFCLTFISPLHLRYILTKLSRHVVGHGSFFKQTCRPRTNKHCMKSTGVDEGEFLSAGQLLFLSKKHVLLDNTDQISWKIHNFHSFAPLRRSVKRTVNRA